MKKFLFDLFPLILFFIVYRYAGIYAATAAAVATSIAQILWLKVTGRPIETTHWINLGIIVLFGGATLLLHDAVFIKWKPTVLYWAFSIALVVSQFAFNKNLIEAMMGKQITLPHRVWAQLNYVWAVFFVLLGILNLFVAYNFSTDAWVNFKLFGATGCLVVFIVGQSLWLAKYMKEE